MIRIISTLFFTLVLLLSNNSFSQNNHAENFKKGLEHYNNKEFDEALEYFNKAILFHRDSSDYYFYRAKTRISLGKLNWATEDLDKAISVNPNISIYYSLLASISYQAGPSNNNKNLRYLELAKKSVELDTASAFNFFIKGKFNYLTQHYFEAIKDFTHSILIDSTNLESYYYRGLSRIKYGDQNGNKDIFNSYKQGCEKAKSEATALWSEYVSDKNQIDSNFYINPKHLYYKIDSINHFKSFSNYNQRILNDLGKAIFSLPLNECKNKEIKLLISIDKSGNSESVEILESETNSFIDSLIIDTIKNHYQKWHPYKEYDVAMDYKAVFTFGVKNVHFYEVTKQFKNEKTILLNYHTRDYVHRIPVRITTYWVSKKIRDEYLKDCEDNSHYYNKGVEAFGKEKYGIAKGYFIKALQSNYYDLDSRYNLGVCYQKLGKNEKACECFSFCNDLGDQESQKEVNQYCK